MKISDVKEAARLINEIEELQGALECLRLNNGDFEHQITFHRPSPRVFVFTTSVTCLGISESITFLAERIARRVERLAELGIDNVRP